MERRVTHAAETFSEEREERKESRDRDEKRKGDQIKREYAFRSRKRDDHKQRGTNKKQLLIQI